MYLFCILLLCHLTRGLPRPIDTVIIQIQQWGVVGGEQIEQQVLLNGVSLTNKSQEVNSFVQTISADAPFPALTGVSQTEILGNHTLLRLRECILEGSEVHWTDRMLCDGTVFLTLDRTDTWTVQTPQALALKELWDQEVERTRRERTHLQEGCTKLMKELRLSEEQSVPGIPSAAILVPFLAILTLALLTIISVLISKKEDLRHPGGVIGSIIHYPQDMTDMTVMPPDKKGYGYLTL
uniref:uncharacterized protein n=1 Tax=Centroberyx gerrardi TaxID=166262 RepID=UPI003AAB1269